MHCVHSFRISIFAMFEEAVNSAQGDGIVFSIIVIVFILIAMLVVMQQSMRDFTAI